MMRRGALLSLSCSFSSALFSNSFRSPSHCAPIRNFSKTIPGAENGRLPLLVSVELMKGRRPYMEDEVVVSKDNHLFAVFDGHAGDGVSKYLQSKFEKYFDEIFQAKTKTSAISDSIVQDALDETAKQIDVEVSSNKQLFEVGSTLNACYINDHEYSKTGSFSIINMNLGDSRSVLSRGGKAVDLSEDHKPDLPREKKRIESVGGSVEWVGLRDKKGNILPNSGVYRVNGNLALSRAIGDCYERPAMSSVPDFTTTVGTREDEFIVCATDGLWDAFSSQDAVSYVHKILEQTLPADALAKMYAAFKTSYESDKESFYPLTLDSTPEEVLNFVRRKRMAAFLVDTAYKRGSGDNISAVVIFLR